ncbi:MAG: hypothetical protein PHY15_04760 [Eubacteriales bacterium]|nr:hypothetical protein [Eubacteriales bacterium]MDD4476483.1 hypothetical protein [Eubacteriales bacterium]
MKKFAILLAALLLLSVTAMFVSAAEFTNVAEGKAYTLNIIAGTPGYGVPDPDDGTGYGDGIDAFRQRLTNGEKAPGPDGGASASERAYVGGQNATEAEYVIDLGSVVEGIKKLDMDLYDNSGWGISAPTSVEYFISDDNENFTSLGVVEAANVIKTSSGTWNRYDMTLDLDAEKSARYVKVNVKVGSHVWSSEIEVLVESDEESPDTSDGFVYAVAALTVSAGAAIIITKKNRSK